MAKSGMHHSDPFYDDLDEAREEASRFEASSQALTLENVQLRARLRECVLLMENDIALGHVVAGETRKKILEQSRELVPKIDK